MAGTREGGLKTVITNRKKYGADFYKKIGAKGGSHKSPDKGFGDGWAGRERASKAGRLGGLKSRRGAKK